MYQTQVLTEEYFKIFSGVYNDFRNCSATDYKFEIPPLEYNDFIECFKKGLLKCIILLEDFIPTGFLAYSTTPDDAIELYILHFLGNEDVNKKYRTLLNAFLQAVSIDRTRKIVSYPMLGKQSYFKEEASSFGFEFVQLAVVAFDMKNRQKIKDFQAQKAPYLPIGYKIVPYKDIYFQELANVIYESFKESSDTKFDPRFLSPTGVQDILSKITTSVYGKFLPLSSKILLFENNVAGFALSNMTNNKIGNVPLVGILPQHRGLGISKILLKQSVDEVIKMVKADIINLTELNASVDVRNVNAYNMYKALGFEELYSYPQAYLSKIV